MTGATQVARSASREQRRLALFIAPAAALFAAFWLLPMVRLVLLSVDDGFGSYWLVLTSPRYVASLAITTALATAATALTLIIAAISGLFLVRNSFIGRNVLVAILTLPLAFPGVVIGFMIIMLGGRLGLVGTLTQSLFGWRYVFAYSFTGLFIGYIYFSIPRVILTIMASAEKLDIQLEEAARSLGANRWQVARDVILPGLMPALISSGAICFATSMGAFGTAFTLNAGIDVMPMLIYNEFTLNANIAIAAALSVILGIITWAALVLARSVAGTSVAAGG
jgi:putative spermidine/putrescine transport system permease protein